jgi:hypothetical protein|eukprot:COSAG06_NODE_13201_length_1283_cov_1.269426_1_plen_209_part_00
MLCPDCTVERRHLYNRVVASGRPHMSPASTSAPMPSNILIIATLCPSSFKRTAWCSAVHPICRYATSWLSHTSHHQWQAGTMHARQSRTKSSVSLISAPAATSCSTASLSTASTASITGVACIARGAGVYAAAHYSDASRPHGGAQTRRKQSAYRITVDRVYLVASVFWGLHPVIHTAQSSRCTADRWCHGRPAVCVCWGCQLIDRRG